MWTNWSPLSVPPLTDSFREFYGFDDEQIKRAIDKYHERFDEKGIFENELIEGIPELLKALKDAGRRVSIASSKPRPLVIRILEHFDIAQYFDTVVGSEFDGRFATKEAVVEEALRQLVPSVYEKEDVAMVGDRKFDIQGARAHGLTGIGVSFGYAGEHELEDAGADYIVDTVEELQRLLLQGSL
ncbi:MAG: HAD hydrolase-like protein [Lachnospiraceae bacterium]